MHTTLSDIRYALRVLLRTPGFTLVAVLTLALGIGANTAIFTVVNALLLKPLPYGHPERLVMVWQDMRARGGPADEWLTPGNYADLRQETAIFEHFAVISGWRPTFNGGAEPEPIVGEVVSHEYFDALGIRPVLGRTFTPADDIPNAKRVVIVDQEFWRTRLGSDRQVVGTILMLSGEPHEVIGVLPEGFRPVLASDASLWRPMRTNTANPSRGSIVLRSVARLREGVSVEEAQAAAATIATRLEAQYPEYNEKTSFNLTPLHDRVVGDIKPGLLALVGAVGFVLLIACANIANLLLARGSARTRELAVRVALGAARGRVIRQLLTESTLLAAIGGIGGILLGIWAVDALVAIAPAGAPRVNEIRLDATVLGFAVALTFVTGLLFGLAPAMQHSRGDTTGSLKEGARGSAGGGGRLMRRMLVTAEVALALMLLTGAGLLLQTFVKLQAADLGFEPHNVLVGFVNPPRASGYDTAEKHRAFYTQVLDKAKAIPGVQHAALASVLPLSGDSDWNFVIEGRPAPQSAAQAQATWYREVSADYFTAMGISIRRGRAFVDGESLPVVVINETFARTHFPNEDPLGRRMRMGTSGDMPWATIVGIAEDAKVRGARGGTRVETYIPYWQYTEPGMNVILKGSTDAARFAAPLRQAVASIDRNVPVSGVTLLSETVRDSVGQDRFFAMLAAAFAALAVALAAIGIYGVMAYAVSQRTTEIGVRMALGATPREVFRLVVGDGLKMTLAGVVVGIVGAMMVARWLAALLFEIAPTDPVTMAVTAVVLVLVAGLASYLPARRATRVDPMVALRAQ